MSLKSIGKIALIAFVAYFVISTPIAAAGLLNKTGGGIGHAAQSVSTLLGHLDFLGG